MTDDIVERLRLPRNHLGCLVIQDEAAAEIERLRSEARVYQDTMQWEQREKDLQAEIERLRSIVAAPAFVPDRPVWLDVNGLPDADWHQQRLLSVTQGTLELARQAMQIRNEEFVNHLYARAISEINQVISSEEPKP